MLTPKKKLFADIYLTNGFNATQAAEMAGYKCKTYESLKVKASTLKNKDADIKEYIREKMSKFEQQFEAKQKELIKFWTRVIRDEETEEKVLYRVIIKDDEPLEFVKRVNGRTSLRNRLKASELLANFYNMFDKNKEGNTLQNITIVRGNKRT